ncbi:diacylglycerol kinase (ATP) [Marchantia polymorpha subsp. ruderalis]|uniref:Diacylglycerol kinase n=1 Tax=Marchantia polymorpha TaxID=3197 RepID=A0A2R6XAS8_MARPO|nr:hypothetical protein MARPO_0026s0082 [Marchantia polymorpha]BBN02113.1 hypothetical protein Mp_2g12900 [Marchantia polymorpha subsp. ruderalis]|eukprot:PTQ43207.1 hypothetical protein MARPO_0026s0082 [Marchantia polymorpha]
MMTEPLRSKMEKDENVELMEEMLIPEYILNREKAPSNANQITCPESPVLVFINTKSGGQLGSQILPHFRALLNPKQVFELPADNPEEILRDFLSHLEKLKRHGDPVATAIRAKLRIVVAGGDGTHGWLLGAVADLKLKDLPPVSTVPLGTGNNLPFSFGWGKKNPTPTVESCRDILLKTADASPMPVDRWHVVIRMSKPLEDSPLSEMKSSKLLASNTLKTHESFSRVPENTESYQEGQHSYQGGFWNYMSIGMDSQVSYAFHTMRNKHPKYFKNQIMNQGLYAFFSCWQGWFCAPCCHPRSKNINTLANIFTARYDGQWDKLHISRRIRSIVILNLPSFSGGFNPWGTPSGDKAKERHLTAPFVNDGLIEIVGFTDGWHGASMIFPRAHGTRIAQAHKVKIEFHKGGEDHTYMRVDGEPWQQELPLDTDPTVMEITHKGQAVILASGDCVAKIIPADESAKMNLPISQATVADEQKQQGSASRKSRHSKKV